MYKNLLFRREIGSLEQKEGGRKISASPGSCIEQKEGGKISASPGSCIEQKEGGRSQLPQVLV